MHTQGRIQDFPKGGFGTRDTKSGVGRGGGGGGGCPLQARDENGGGPTRKAGGGGGCCPLQARYKKRGVCVCVCGGGGGGGDAVYLRPAIRKAEVGGGGVGGAVRRFSPDTKSGEWGGCLAEEGEVPYMKGGVATPNPPPPNLDPPLILVTMHAC